MKAYRNFVVHMDYDGSSAHIIINECETGDNIERTLTAKDLDSLSKKVGDEFYMAFTDWFYVLDDDLYWMKEEEVQKNDR